MIFKSIFKGSPKKGIAEEKLPVRHSFVELAVAGRSSRSVPLEEVGPKHIVVGETVGRQERDEESREQATGPDADRRDRRGAGGINVGSKAVFCRVPGCRCAHRTPTVRVTGIGKSALSMTRPRASLMKLATNRPLSRERGDFQPLGELFARRELPLRSGQRVPDQSSVLDRTLSAGLMRVA